MRRGGGTYVGVDLGNELGSSRVVTGLPSLRSELEDVLDSRTARQKWLTSNGERVGLTWIMKRIRDEIFMLSEMVFIRPK
jgi:hypothetical protein